MYQPLLLGIPGYPKLLENAPEKGEAGIRLCPKTTVLDIQVGKAAVWIEYGRMLRGAGSDFGSVDWQGGYPQLPVQHSVPEDVDAVRVWRFSKEEPEPQVLIRFR